ncbi:MAG TPA: hypothetical protein VGO00_11690, partial [Kofleriaceae bacterium]|nr:hypothetical protein [Kofleriaceae bacterium]
MRRLLVLVAACYAPTAQSGSPCDPGPCPSGLICSPATHTCEVTAVDIDAATDTSVGPWLAGYTHRKRLVITSTTTETLVDFAVSVLEPTDPDLVAHALPDGSDIVFTAGDALTVLSAEHVAYDAATGALEAWVRTTLAPGPTILDMYYDGPKVAPTTTAWSALFAGVWHMSGGAMAPDSTAHGNAADAPSATRQPATIAGIVGEARNYDGVDDSLVVADPQTGELDFAMGSFSYSVWVNVATSAGAFDLPFHKGGSSIDEP